LLQTKTLAVLAAIGFGILLGLGAMTFGYAEGLSYLSTDPAACANCHIMQPQYDSWQKGSHHGVATCVECHLPADFFGKYLAKAENGWNHSKAFTLQNFHEPIVINQENSNILHRNCLNCHADLVHAQGGTDDGATPRCVGCHASVGHGEPVGLGGPWRRDEANLGGQVP